MPKAKARKTSRPRKRAPRRKRNVQAVETALAALTHDIRTPLHGILALTELLAASDLGARERGWASAAKNAAEHLARYTDVVCDAVRADAVGITLRQDIFSPRLLAEAVGASLEARAQTGGLKATIAIGSGLPERLMGDPVRLRAALENIIDNAVKFTARGGVAFGVTSSPARRGKVRLIFAVKDSGIGLKPAEIKRLFRPFAQANDAVARRYGGSGLGLTLVKRLAKTMGGDLTVTSKPGLGSTFNLSVTLDPAPAESQTTARDAKARGATEALDILCVEDNPYGRVVMNTILSEFGHRIDFAASGEAGVTAASRGHYRLVLMDITLPGIDGIETTRRIRALPGSAARVPIVGVSGHTGADEEKAARAAGMTDYLAKPVTPAALAAAIAKAVS